jgi:hypothetical protein
VQGCETRKQQVIQVSRDYTSRRRRGQAPGICQQESVQEH